MKQKGGHVGSLVGAAGTAMVPFALYQANKMYARRVTGKSRSKGRGKGRRRSRGVSRRSKLKNTMNRIKSTFKRMRRNRRSKTRRSKTRRK